MKLKVPWSLLPESAVQFLSLLYQFFCKENNQECTLKKYEQFSKCCFGEISSQRLTTISPYICNK